MFTSRRGISIRQVAAEDMPFVFRLYTDPCRNHLWTQSRRVYDEPSFREGFSTWMNSIFAARFIVESGQRPVGLVVAYDHFPEHGYAKIGTMLQEDCVGHGGGIVATALLTDYLFRTLPLRKVYLESYGFNPRVVRMLRKAGLPEEGCLKGSYYWDGAYWDLHIFAVYREAWRDLSSGVLRVKQRGADTRAARPSRTGDLVQAGRAGIACGNACAGNGCDRNG